MPTAQIGSHTVYFDELGSGHPLIFVSGLGASRLGWWKQIEPFSKKFHVINVDNRDAGDSAASAGPYTIAEMASDVAGVIQNLELGTAYLVGISMGGFILIEFAIRYPELLDKLVLVSTSAGGKSSVRAQPEILALLGRTEGEEIETRTRRTFTAIAGKDYMASHPEDLDHIVRNAQAKPMSLASYQRQLGAVMAHDATDRLDKISAPTLVIHGDYDPLIPYENGKYLAAHIKSSRISTYQNVGHLPPIEAAERFNSEVMEFFA